jgi:hypothetical protein
VELRNRDALCHFGRAHCQAVVETRGSLQIIAGDGNGDDCGTSPIESFGKVSGE